MSKLRVKIRNFGEDALGSIRAAKARFQKILHSSEADIEVDPITTLARTLHQGILLASVEDVISLGKNATKIVFPTAKPVYFSPGQYLTVTLLINESIVTRPYSIASSPSLGREGKVEIIVKEIEEGILSSYLVHKLAKGDPVCLEIGLGEFVYNRFRDAPHIIGVAGGVGITPFLSMAKWLSEQENPPYDLTILYGSQDRRNILAKEELEALEGEHVHVVHVLSNDPLYSGEKGFITQEILQKYAPEGPVSYFLCGPRAMQDFVFGELEKMGVDLRRVRSECPASLDKAKGNVQIYELIVHQAECIYHINARDDEPLIVALERSGIYIRSCCRQGTCGACRAQVLKGDYFVPEENDGRRHADIEFGYVHACHCFPRSDMEIRVNASVLPREQLIKEEE